jgi:hypothetical protein
MGTVHKTDLSITYTDWTIGRRCGCKVDNNVANRSLLDMQKTGIIDEKAWRPRNRWGSCHANSIVVSL